MLVIFAAIVTFVGLMAGLVGHECPAPIESEGTTTELPTTVATATTTVPSGPQYPWMDGFLPTYLQPLHYDMWLYPDFYNDGSIFYGRETIHIRLHESTRYLLVNIKAMTITHRNVSYEDGTPVQVADEFEYGDNQYYVVETNDEMPAGATVRLYLEFYGSLVNGIVGYYKSNYTNANTGAKSWLATSKFQPSDARKAFPNFDEPRFKSTFKLTQKHWNNFTALSNTPVESISVIDSTWSETTFQKTVNMSSYLVCFIVCDFEYTNNTLDTVSNTGQPHRVWATPDKVDQTEYALDVGQSIADYFADIFDEPFTLPKLDQLAVPDYPSGATEHWGLVTYREARLLYDPTQVGSYDKQKIASIVAHELAHSYFGDLVTCLWWDEIWLNEAFAVLYDYYGVNHVSPEWEMPGQFLIRTQQPVMTTDAGGSSRPVVVPITNPDEANAAFDAITYDKGASMLRMVESIMEPVNFQLGLRDYLDKHAFSSVVTSDLWASLQPYAGDVNLAQVMAPWVYQMGLPVVTITESTTPPNNLVAEQIRFMNDPAANISEPVSPYNYKWYIPLTYETEAGVTGSIWLNNSGATFPDPRGADKNQWIKFNKEQVGFYRVAMPNTMWGLIQQQLSVNHSVFTALDRSHIVDDALSLSRAARLSYDVSLGITQYLYNETHFFPWRSAKTLLDYLKIQLYSTSDNGYWREYMRYLTQPLMSSLQVRDSLPEFHLEIMLREVIMAIACGNGNTECLKNATDIFLRWIDNEANAVPLNLRRMVYGFGVESTGDAAWRTVWDRYLATTSGQEKDHLMYALAQTTQLWLVQRYLDYTFNTTLIRSQDFFTVISYLGSNPVANRYVWEWTQANYDYLEKRFGTADRSFGRMVPGLVSNYNTDFQLQEVVDFYAKYPNAGAGAAARQQSIDSIKNNISWMNLNRDTIFSWLKSVVTL